MPHLPRLATLALTVIVLAGCAAVPPAVLGGPDLELDAALAQDAAVWDVSVQAPEAVWRRFAETRASPPAACCDTTAEAEFADLVGGEVGRELRRCTKGGGRRLDVRIRIDALRYDQRFGSLVDGKGADQIGGVVEVVDPARQGAVVARRTLEVSAPSGRLLARIVSDRTMNLGEHLGRSLCADVFRKPPA